MYRKFMKEKPNLQRSQVLSRKICKMVYMFEHTHYSVMFNSMGLAGLRTMDNMAFFDAKKPLVVVYYEVDYERNPKGKFSYQ